MGGKVRVAIGYFHSDKRTDLKRVCENAGLEVVGTEALKDELLQLVDAQRPEIVILGHELPCAGDGEEAANLIMEKYPEIIVINYSGVNWPAHLTINPDRMAPPLLQRLLAALGEA